MLGQRHEGAVVELLMSMMASNLLGQADPCGLPFG